MTHDRPMTGLMLDRFGMWWFCIAQSSRSAHLGQVLQNRMEGRSLLQNVFRNHTQVTWVVKNGIYCPSEMEQEPNMMVQFMIHWCWYTWVWWVPTRCRLVVEPYPSEKYESQLGWIPNIWKNKKCLKPPTRYVIILYVIMPNEPSSLKTVSGTKQRLGPMGTVKIGPWFFQVLECFHSIP